MTESPCCICAEKNYQKNKKVVAFSEKVIIINFTKCDTQSQTSFAQGLISSICAFILSAGNPFCFNKEYVLLLGKFCPFVKRSNKSKNLISDLKKDLEFIYSLNIEHVSCYSLIIEEHTKLGIKNIENINEELDYEMYNVICDFMRDHGYKHYEISNFSKEGYHSRHNLVYWNNLEYYGFGMGASSYIDNRRCSNTRSINKYLNGEYLLEEEYLDLEDLVYYEVMLNLRKSDGIDLDKLYSKYRVSIDYHELVKLGLLKVDKNMLYIPEDKWYISNDIIIRLMECIVYE